MLMGQRSVGTYGIQSVGNKQTVEAVGMRVHVHTVHTGTAEYMQALLAAEIYT